MVAMGRMIGRLYVQTKNKWNYGATTFFEIEIEKYTEMNLGTLLDGVLSEHDEEPTSIEHRNKLIKNILEKDPSTIHFTHGPFSGEVFSLTIKPYPSAHTETPSFVYNSNNIFFMFPTLIDNFHLYYARRVIKIIGASAHPEAGGE